MSALCYLCGSPLTAPTNRDHVPMKQLWTPEIRKQYSPQLDTLEVHPQCNSDFQSDEEYFVASILPFAPFTLAGKSHFSKMKNETIAGTKVPLKSMVKQQFHRQIGGIFLPNNIIAYSFDSARMRRVIWKIVRGLHFRHFHEILSSSCPATIEFFTNNNIPDHFKLFQGLDDNPEHGKYPAIFSYKYKTIEDEVNHNYWAMLFLDCVIVTAVFEERG